MLICAVVLALAVGLTAWKVTPFSTGGLIAVVVAAVGFPILGVWAGRLSTQNVVGALERSARARNELLGLAIGRIQEEIRTSTQSQTSELRQSIGSAATLVTEAAQSVGREVGAVRAAVENLSQSVTAAREASDRAQRESIEQAERTRASFEHLAAIETGREERARPDLHGQTETRSAWVFFRHNWLLIGNIGGSATAVTVSFRFNDRQGWTAIAPFDLGTQGNKEIDLGDVSAAGQSGEVLLIIDVHDEANHHHEVRDYALPLNGNQWVRLPMRTLQ